ncbi:hypothetical protein [Streptomyces sp. Agncl-13]|uniref:hypothetical protein n=1 Tax=Streptomyces sp. Agncl-13 TaxID=3400628 RepID=UPI003A89E9A0
MTSTPLNWACSSPKCGRDHLVGGHQVRVEKYFLAHADAGSAVEAGPYPACAGRE